MMKNTVFAFAFLACLLGTAVPASANQGQKEDCDKSGGQWRPFSGVPQCDCSRRSDLFPLLAPGSDKTLIAIRNRAKVTKDVCENRKIENTSTNIDKGKEKSKSEKTDAPPPPAKFGAMLSPGDMNDVKGGEVVKQKLVVTSNSKLVAKFVASCSTCNVNNESPLIVGNPQIPEAGYVFNLAQTNPETASTATFVVRVFDKKGNEIGSFNASIGWLAKAPVVAPTPPPAPAPSPCVKSRGLDTVTLTGEKGCACLAENGIERMAVNGVCVDKPKAVVVEEDEEGQLHFYTKLNAGYGGSSSFRTPFYGLIVGLSLDLHRMVKAYGGAGFSLPGAKLDATQDRAAMDRGYSSNFEAGLMFLPIPEIELKGGVWYRATGLDGASSPIRNLIAATVGVGYSPPISGMRLSVGPEFYLGGADKQGGISAKAFFGGGIAVTFEFFNEPNRGKK